MISANNFKISANEKNKKTPENPYFMKKSHKNRYNI